MDLIYKDYGISIDEEDMAYLAMYNWYISDHGYLIYKPTKQPYIRFHRLIINCPDNMYVDHIDGNKLNNQKYNLRICTQLQNTSNRKLNKNSTSGYKGVCWCKRKEKWIAHIRFNGFKKTLGRYDNIIDAALAYDNAAKEHFGEFAKLNFPEEWVYDDIVYY